MSPGSVTERLHFFVAEYDAGRPHRRRRRRCRRRRGHRGIELGFDEALAMVARGEIVDAKTIMLLQYGALHLFGGVPAPHSAG